MPAKLGGNLVRVSSDYPVEIVDSNKGQPGAFFNFWLEIQDHQDYSWMRYMTSIWIPKGEVVKWKERLRGGNIFFMTGGWWVNQEWDGGKYPIAKLKVSKYDLIPLKVPLQIEEKL